jgi:hypothetical protein
MQEEKKSNFKFTEELRDSLGLRMSYAEFMALMEVHDNNFTLALGSVLQQQQELASLPARIMNEVALRKRNIVMNQAIDAGMEDFEQGEKAVALVGSYHLLGSDSLRVHLRNNRKVYSVIFAGIERDSYMFTVADPTIDTMGDISDDLSGAYLPEPSRGV